MRQFVCRGSDQLAACAKAITGLSVEKPWRILITPYRSKRSPEQNSLLWAIYTEIGKETGNDPETVHEYCKAKFLPPRVIQLGDEEAALPGSTAGLDVPSFSEFVERVQSWAAQEFALQL